MAQCFVVQECGASNGSPSFEAKKTISQEDLKNLYVNPEHLGHVLVFFFHQQSNFLMNKLAEKNREFSRCHRIGVPCLPATRFRIAEGFAEITVTASIAMIFGPALPLLYRPKRFPVVLITMGSMRKLELEDD